MEALIESQHGVTALIIILALHLVAKMGEFLFHLLKKKTEGSDHQITRLDLALTQNTQVVRELRIQIQQLERELGDVHKLNADIQKLFSAVKYMAGKKWPEIHKKLTQDNLP